MSDTTKEIFQRLWGPEPFMFKDPLVSNDHTLVGEYLMRGWTRPPKFLLDRPTPSRRVGFCKAFVSPTTPVPQHN